MILYFYNHGEFSVDELAKISKVVVSGVLVYSIILFVYNIYRKKK